MKWFFLLFSIIRPFFSSDHNVTNPANEIKEMVRANAMKVVLLFATASTLATVFAGGVILIAVDIGAQYDQNGYLYFSSMILMGLVLSLLSASIFAFVAKSFSNYTHKDGSRVPIEIPANVDTTHPLQDAVALLILDFVKEREMKREHNSPVPNTTNERKPENTEKLRH